MACGNSLHLPLYVGAAANAARARNQPRQTARRLLNMATHPAIRPGAFIRYKFLNSLLLDLSVGAVFILYTPLSPAIFSAGGIGLALGTLMVATQYRRILAPGWFFRLSLLVELVTLSGVAAVFILPLELPLALFVYIGYQPVLWVIISCDVKPC